MSTYDNVRMIIATVFILILLVFCFNRVTFKKGRFDTKFIAKTAIFAAMSVILYTVPYLKFSLPIFPNFLEIHLDEIPALIASFAYGPVSGLFVIIIKTIIKLPLTTTMCVGELADMLYSICFIIPAALIYRKHNHLKGALLALLVGTVIQCFVASFFTSFVMLQFYMSVMGLKEETIIAMCKAVNPNVDSLGFTFLLFIALPFNAIKDGIVVAATFLLYKRLHVLIDKSVSRKRHIRY